MRSRISCDPRHLVDARRSLSSRATTDVNDAESVTSIAPSRSSATWRLPERAASARDAELGRRKRLSIFSNSRAPVVTDCPGRAWRSLGIPGSCRGEKRISSAIERCHCPFRDRSATYVARCVVPVIHHHFASGALIILRLKISKRRGWTW